MNFKKHKIVFGAIAFALAVSAFSASGCGDGGSGVSAEGSSVSVIASQKTADIQIKFDIPEYKAIDAEIQSFEFSLYDGDLESVYSKTALRSELKQGRLTLGGVPVSAKSLVCLLKDAYHNPIGLMEISALELSPGVTAVIDNPDYASTAAELGDRLNSLTIASQTPVKLNTGEKTQLKVEGVFLCKNGVELACNLTDCSRLVYQSSNNSILRHVGGGKFKALSGGSVKVYASLGQMQAEADIIVKAAAHPSASDPADSDTDGGADTDVTKPDTDEDPATIADPEPLPAETPCSVRLDLNSAELPSGVTVELRGYDANNLLRFRKEDISLSETFKDVDDSVSKLAGVMLEKDGQVHGIFLADVNLKGQKTCTVSPEIITGDELALRGEMILSSDKPVYDINDETIYQKTENNRSITVKCDAAVRYTVIPGVWEYTSSGGFLDELCSFESEGDGTDDYGVFRFFEAGTYRVSVRYRGVTGVFSVTITDSSSPVIDDYKINIDLSSSGLPSGATYEVRGYNSGGSLLFSEQNVSNLNSTFADVDKNVTKLIAVIKASNGEPYAMFTQNISLTNGQVYHVSSPTLISGQQLAQQKGSLSFSIASTSYDLKNKTTGGYLIISTTPSLTYNYGNGWTASFGSSNLRAWNDFALNSSPYLEYSSSSLKNELKVYETGSYTISASYRGLTSSSVTVNVTDSTPAPVTKYSVTVNFASSGLPSNSSLIYCQLFKDGAAVSDEFNRSSASSLTFDDVSSQANGIVVKVKDTSGQLVGLLYKSLSFNSDNKATLSSVSVATGSGMNTYIKSFTAAPSDSLKTVGTYVTGTAQAELTFNSGKILQTRNVSTEAAWSSSDMSKGTANNSWKVSRAGESSLRATLGSKTADLKVYASGSYNDSVYQYGEANLNSKKAVSMVINTSDNLTSSERISSKIIGGEAANSNMSVDEKPVSDLFSNKPIRRCAVETLQLDQEYQSSKTLKNASLLFDESESNLDYKNAKFNDILYPLYGGERLNSTTNKPEDYYFIAEVIVTDDIIDVYKNVYGLEFSNKLIFVSEIVADEDENGEYTFRHVIDVNNKDQILRLWLLDFMLTKGNPFDPDQMPILDRLHNTWGHENGYNGSNNGGQDGTDKLIVILRDGNELEGTCGYVRPDDTLKSRNQSLYSNQGEIIYINTDLLLNEETLGDIFCTCAHELKHLISVNMKKFRDGQNNGYWLKNEETSLEEGTACFSELICGFGLNYRDLSSTYSNLDNLMKYDARMSLGYCQDFFNDHNSFSIKNHDGSGKSYGGDYAFISYIYDRFGLNTIKDFAQNNPYTLNLNDEYELLAKIVSNNCGQNLSFYDLYSDFGKACLLNSKSSFVPDTFKMTTIKPSKLYQYIAEDNTTISNYFMPTVNISTMGTDNIIPWSLNYYATPNMTYSTGVTSSIFGLWGGLTNTFKMMLFDSSYKYESDIN